MKNPTRNTSQHDQSSESGPLRGNIELEEEKSGVHKYFVMAPPKYKGTESGLEKVLKYRLKFLSILATAAIILALIAVLL